MRTSKLIAPIKEPIQRFFTEELGLGHLITKMAANISAVLVVFLLGLFLRYTSWEWTMRLWYCLMIAGLIRVGLRYWWPWIWQQISNAAKKIINKHRENDFLELDMSDKRPFPCSNCRNAKMYYERLEQPRQSSPNKPICTKCGTTEAVKVLAMWQQNPGMDAGSDSLLPEDISKALRERDGSSSSISAPQ